MYFRFNGKLVRVDEFVFSLLPDVFPSFGRYTDNFGMIISSGDLQLNFMSRTRQNLSVKCSRLISDEYNFLFWK